MSTKTFFIKEICIIGAGYVGGTTGIVIAAKCSNIKVVIVDSFESKILAWNSNNLPIFEDMACDFSYLESACRKILKSSTTPKIVVEKSTVPVLFSNYVSKILNDPSVHLVPKNGLKSHVVLSNPEFMAEGSAIEDLMNPDRILIGGDTTSDQGKIAVKMLSEIYQNWVPKKKILEISTNSSELAKLSANAFLAQRVSSINSISAICEKTNCDIREVANAIGMDHRIGKHFLKAGLGFGGSCFPKDTLHLNLDYEGLLKSMNRPAYLFDGRLVLDHKQLKKFGYTVYALGISPDIL